MSSRLFDGLGTTEPLAQVFSDESVLAAMLRFEVALARAEAGVGVIPEAAADAIARAAADATFDVEAIGRAARASGTIAIPFVEALIARVAASAPEAAGFVHRGATSQDVSDTALVLCLVRAAGILEADHLRLSNGLRRLSEAHADTVMLARTLLQPAPPTTFGLKAAGWFGSVSRGAARLAESFETACLLQFGGASGTLAALAEHGPAVSAALARQLGLPEANAPWHVHRDRLAGLVTACGIYTASLGKMAQDISLLMQHEVSEAAEPGGGSSTMPHKRNPAGCAIALAAATRAPGLVGAFLSGMLQQHERGVGNWHAEAATVSALVQATGAAVAAMADVVEQLEVDPTRMRANIAATGGVIFAERAMILLGPALGRDTAAQAIATALAGARRSNGDFTAALLADARVQRALEAGELTNLAEPDAYLGSAEQFRRRLLAGIENPEGALDAPVEDPR